MRLTKKYESKSRYVLPSSSQLPTFLQRSQRDKKGKTLPKELQISGTRLGSETLGMLRRGVPPIGKSSDRLSMPKH